MRDAVIPPVGTELLRFLAGEFPNPSERLAECKECWRKYPHMPGYCTINLGGSAMTPEVEAMAAEIKAEFGEVSLVNFSYGWGFYESNFDKETAHRQPAQVS